MSSENPIQPSLGDEQLGVIIDLAPNRSSRWRSWLAPLFVAGVAGTIVVGVAGCSSHTPEQGRSALPTLGSTLTATPTPTSNSSRTQSPTTTQNASATANVTAPPSGSSVPTATTGSASPGRPLPSPKAKPSGNIEEAYNRHGVPTFADYGNASAPGPSISFGQSVQVSCKIYDPSIPSARPGGYWYRIASSPWNNSYYAIANTFLNGDPPDGPYTHPYDPTVPDC
jgi:hypothetical protein